MIRDCVIFINNKLTSIIINQFHVDTVVYQSRAIYMMVDQQTGFI